MEDGYNYNTWLSCVVRTALEKEAEIATVKMLRFLATGGLDLAETQEYIKHYAVKVMRRRMPHEAKEMSEREIIDAYPHMVMEEKQKSLGSLLREVSELFTVCNSGADEASA